MEFTIGERLGLMMVLPKEGDWLTLKKIRMIREEISESLSKDEAAGILTKDENGFKWASALDHAVEIDVTPKIINSAKETLKSLNKREKLTEAFAPIYLCLVGDPETGPTAPRMLVGEDG